MQASPRLLRLSLRSPETDANCMQRLMIVARTTEAVKPTRILYINKTAAVTMKFTRRFAFKHLQINDITNDKNIT